MAKPGRTADVRPLRRKTGTRRPKKTLVVFCEGEKTEPQYLEALKKQPEIRDAAAVELRIETGHGGAVPKTLVTLAIDARDRAVAEEAEIDEFWCVFDVEWPKNHTLVGSPDRHDREDFYNEGSESYSCTDPSR